MEWLDLTSFISGILGSGLIGILFKIWLDHRLKIERENLLEKRKFEQKRREASKAVVEILAEWIRPKYYRGSTNKNRWQLQKTYWENILLLDVNLFNLLSTRLANDSNAVDTNELVVQVRQILLNLDQPDIQAEQLNNWNPIL